MNIEEDLFNKYQIDKDKLIKYGFIKENNVLIFKKNILDNKFMVIIEYDKDIKGKIIELDFNEEYTNYRREELGEFNSKIKDDFIKILIDIRNHCCYKDIFKYPQTIRINNYIINKYNVNPEFLWVKYPEYAIYRKTKKWFALIGNVPINKIDKKIDSNKEVDIINVKVSPNKIEDLLKINGYYKAYHMNKLNWITIILDDTISDSEIEEMIYNSYDLVEK